MQKYITLAVLTVLTPNFLFVYVRFKCHIIRIVTHTHTHTDNTRLAFLIWFGYVDKSQENSKNLRNTKKEKLKDDEKKNIGKLKYRRYKEKRNKQYKKANAERKKSHYSRATQEPQNRTIKRYRWMEPEIYKSLEMTPRTSVSDDWSWNVRTIAWSTTSDPVFYVKFCRCVCDCGTRRDSIQGHII